MQSRRCLGAEHRFERQQEPEIFLRRKRTRVVHQLGHAFARLLFPLLRPRWWRDHVERECAHRLGASDRRERGWIKCALFDWLVDLAQKLLLLASHDVLLMQRDRE